MSKTYEEAIGVLGKGSAMPPYRTVADHQQFKKYNRLIVEKYQHRTDYDKQQLQAFDPVYGDQKEDFQYRTKYDKKQLQTFDPWYGQYKEDYNGNKKNISPQYREDYCGSGDHRTLGYDDPYNVYSYGISYPS